MDYLRCNIINSQKILMLKKDYKVGDIAFAKDTEQLWWPVYIISIANKDNKTLYNVTYLNKDLSREVTSEELKIFEVRNKGSKRAKGNRGHRSKRNYSIAVSTATRILKGESTFEGKIFIKM